MVATLVLLLLLGAGFAGGFQVGFLHGERRQRKRLAAAVSAVPQEIAGVVLPAHDDPRWRWAKIEIAGCPHKDHLRFSRSSIVICTHDHEIYVSNALVNREHAYREAGIAYVRAVRSHVICSEAFKAIEEAT